MRLVLDTNTIISGLLWHGPPRALLDAARKGTVTLCTSAVLLAEFEVVLPRAKFAARLASARLTRSELIEGYASLAQLVEPATISAVSSDPNDDHVLACALAAKADAIVSGDAHLLNLKRYHNMPIVSAVEAVKLI